MDTLEGRVVHADVDDRASFTSSDGLINQIYANNRWTMLNNSMSFPTDNPVRDERTPPGMDVQAYQDASTRDFDMGRFYAKYLDDVGARHGWQPGDERDACNTRLDVVRAVRRRGNAGPSL